MKKNIKLKERNAIIQSLKSGVVPKIGLQYIQVGRNKEISSFIKNIESIEKDGTFFRFVIGEYGSGKTFFIQLVKEMALTKNLVVINADLSPEKRLNGSNGQARKLYSELMSSCSTRSKKDGNALTNILDNFITEAREYSEKKEISILDAIRFKLKEVKAVNGGYDFSIVLNKYWEAYDSGDDILKDNTLRWFKGEYSTKTEAKNDLGVRTIIDDYSFYDSLKLFSVLVRKAGYEGLLICLDEMVNLFKITNSVSRKNNYEEILRILNDTLQGNIKSVGFIMGGTPEFLTDRNRGLYSYEALKSRLAENNFAKELGIVDYDSIVLRLSNLSKEEIFVLLCKLRDIYASGDKEKYLISDDGLQAYLKHCYQSVGECYFKTPRNTIKDFLDLLSILDQNPDLQLNKIIKNIDVKEDKEETEVGNIASTFKDETEKSSYQKLIDNKSNEDEFATLSI